MRQTITALSVALFMFASGLAHAERVELDRVVAIVNGTVITWSELREQIPPDRIEPATKLPAEEASAAIRKMESEFLDNLIEMKLQLIEAKRLGIDISDAEVDAAIGEIKAKFSLTEENFMRSLEAQGLNLKRYKANIHDQITVSRVVSQEVRNKIMINESDVDAQFRAEFPALANKDSREARIRVIRLEYGEARAESATMELGADLARRAGGGEDFGKLAREYSADPSASAGGDIGFIKRGMILPEIEQTAFALKPGGVSEPFRAAGAIYLVKAESFKDDTTTIEAKKNAIREKLRDATLWKDYSAWIAGLKGRANIEIRK